MRSLAAVDWIIIAMYVAFALTVGSLFVKQASTGVSSFFVGDRKLPWWIAGTSIVATTFAADTPLAVTGIVASGGVSGNWIWWCWAIAHVSATFLFARMWRRSGVITDAEITELRYAGRPAAALRGFKAVYFGVFINCLTMAWVIAAMVKIAGAFFPEVSPGLVITLCVMVSVTYTTLGGFRGVVITDVVQFTMGMLGAIALAWYGMEAFGGIGELPADISKVPAGGEQGVGMLGALAAEVGPKLADVTDFIPSADHPTMNRWFFVALLIAGWWRYAEGNGYIVQRLAACRDEAEAQAASLWFAVAHNALRPWPWILIGLASLIVYPANLEVPERISAPWGAGAVTLTPGGLDPARGGTVTVEGLGEATGCSVAIDGVTLAIPDGAGSRAVEVPALDGGGIVEAELRCDVPAGGPAAGANARGFVLKLEDREMGYPLLMGHYLPTGLLGLVIASLLAAFMSTIDTHTNWGASYLVNDVYRRFIRPDADERHYVWVSRGCIVLMAILAGLSALIIANIASVWRFLITLGAGLGSVTAARWYWSRVTPHAEFAALGVSTVLGVGLELFGTETLFGGPNPLHQFTIPGWAKMLIVAVASLSAWVPTALFGPRNDPAVLRSFAEKVRPPGPGWAAYRSADGDPIGPAVVRFVIGCGVVFGTLYGIGELLIGRALVGAGVLVVCASALIAIARGGGQK